MRRSVKFNKMETKNEVWISIWLIVAGMATGILSGFFGGGGGMLVVPALSGILKISEKQAHATAIAVILPVTAISAAVYFIRGVSIGDGFGATMGGVVAGGLIGAALLSKLSSKLISAVFYFIMIAAGIKMLI